MPPPRVAFVITVVPSFLAHATPMGKKAMCIPSGCCVWMLFGGPFCPPLTWMSIFRLFVLRNLCRPRIQVPCSKLTLASSLVWWIVHFPRPSCRIAVFIPSSPCWRDVCTGTLKTVQLSNNSWWPHKMRTSTAISVHPCLPRFPACPLILSVISITWPLELQKRGY